MRSSRSLTALAIAVVSAALLPSCGEDNPSGLPDVARADIRIAVTPTPVEGAQSPITGTISAAYTVTIGEFNGLGGTINFISSVVFDPETGAQVALNYFDSSDLIVFVGDDRIEPGGLVEVPTTMSYFLPDFRKEADLTVSVQVRDDRGSLINRSILVKIL